VTGLTASASAGGTIILSWTIPGEADLAGVEITWDNGGTTPVAVSVGAMTFITPALTNGVTYTFTVKCVDLAGNYSTGATASATADATPPDEVEFLAGTGAWVDSDSDGTDDYFDLNEAHEGDGSLDIGWNNPAEGTTDLAGVLVSWTGATGFPPGRCLRLPV
jgi:hypothetical protein